MACKKKSGGGSMAPKKSMKAGGPTSLDRKNLGRNMSRAKNQSGSK